MCYVRRNFLTSLRARRIALSARIYLYGWLVCGFCTEIYAISLTQYVFPSLYLRIASHSISECFRMLDFNHT